MRSSKHAEKWTHYLRKLSNLMSTLALAKPETLSISMNPSAARPCDFPILMAFKILSVPLFLYKMPLYGRFLFQVLDVWEKFSADKRSQDLVVEALDGEVSAHSAFVCCVSPVVPLGTLSEPLKWRKR